MMFCNNCGKEMIKDAKFCNMCGAKAVYLYDSNAIEEPVSDTKKVCLIVGASLIGGILAFGIFYFTLAIIMYL